tara:strand:+ start:751 stop:1449 length:699 start_codon:yes stop_codon:yes gene_type:complete
MKTLHLSSLVIIFLLFTAFKPSVACEYAGSNLNFVTTQTEKAIAQDDINLVRYHTYKALSAIDKSKKQLDTCGCEYAAIGVEESTYQLKRAAKSTNLAETKALLKQALDHARSSLDAIHEHENHLRKPMNDMLAMNTNATGTTTLQVKSDMAPLQEAIDTALENYRISLNKVVNTVDCKEAKAFAERIYSQCELELLKSNLTEGKKYYNLKTQEITSEALERIGTCIAPAAN